MILQDTIVALATPPGAGAIAVIRVSGKEAIPIVSKIFHAKSGKNLKAQKSHTLHLGYIMDGDRTLDEVLVSLFKGSNSYTGEPTVEISCHGSPYIQQEIIQLLLRSKCRMAEGGEFTFRAFVNGKLDLSQAEAVADLIASESEASHQIAMQQMRGGFSNEIHKLREELINFASLIELELDFAEEDVEFANRDEFKALIDKIIKVLKYLIDSFSVGNVIKNGIPVTIVGEPNVGKSTLLNTLLNEDRAIVSDIAGTTRDTIEDEIIINGISFRFIDTAGIRDTKDVIESIGIQKTFEKIDQAKLVIYLLNAQKVTSSEINLTSEIEKIKNKYPQKSIIISLNKIDQLTSEEVALLEQKRSALKDIPILLLSAKSNEGVEALKTHLLSTINTTALHNQQTIVTNSRHYDALLKALEEIQNVRYGLDNQVSGDLLAVDIRETLYHFGKITGEITSDDLLTNIFSNFCIGK